MADVRVAFGFVRLCAGPMILANSCAVTCAVALVSLLSRRERKSLDREHRQLTQTFSKWLSAVVLVAFCATSVFTWVLQTSSAEDSNRQLLTLNLDDVKRDILDASDANLLKLTRGVAADLDAAGEIDGSLLSSIQEKPGNDFSEINVVDGNGIITCSTTPAYFGFDMASGEQSGEFLVLLDGVREYVQSHQPVSKDGETCMKYAAVALERGGFVQVGYNAKRFRQDIDQRVVGAAKNCHVGENGYLLIKKLVVENIHEINHSLREITGGNLNVSVNVRTNEEFVSLSDDISSTVLTLKGYIARAAARLAFLIADVSGKGITAAMFMMKAKTLIKSYAEKEGDVAAILTQANQALCEGNDAEMFVTCWMGILRFSTHTVSFANAGHNPPLIRRRGGRFEYFKSRPGFVLGGMEGVRYRSGELAQMDRATAFVEDTLRAAGADGKTVVKMNIAVDEIFSNIARYSGASGGFGAI